MIARKNTLENAGANVHNHFKGTRFFFFQGYGAIEMYITVMQPSQIFKVDSFH